MAKKEQSKRQKSIKSKLLAAVCMLLVSCIMMVSSTYAWFTLSTAPEVTGIQTSVGANGNLEMALLPKSGALTDISSAAGDSMSVQNKVAANVTWGNLVDLDDDSYGLEGITLYPAQLHLSQDGVIDVSGSILSTPEYGADGRVTHLVHETVTGYYDSGASQFAPNEYYGVRAVGVASGMTDRQLSYRNARAAASTAMGLAKTYASQSLNASGSDLANIAIKHGMGDDDGKYNKDDVAAMRKIITDLKKNGGVLDQIETAYIQYILAFAASNITDGGENGTAGSGNVFWSTIKDTVEGAGTLAAVEAKLTELAGAANVQVPSVLSTAIDDYEDLVKAVTDADSALSALETTLSTDADAKFNWSEVSAVLTKLANPEKMTINGFSTSGIKDKLGELVSSVTSEGGLTVAMASGGGVYADIADHCGDYTASVNIERVEYNNIVLNNMAARMETETDMVKPENGGAVYLAQLEVAVKDKAPAGASDTAMPITETYGYIIDLAFRTNAASSDLLLETQGKDRIYSDNTNEDTMGHGASMTFTATTTDFTPAQIKALMEAVRIVFFEPKTGNILANARLDTANIAEGTTMTAPIYLYSITGGETSYDDVKSTDTFDADKTYYTRTSKDVYTAIPAADLTAGWGSYAETEVYVKVESSESYVLVSKDTVTAPVESTTYYTKSVDYTYTEDSTVSADNFSAKVTAGLYTASTSATDTNKLTGSEAVITPLSQNTAVAVSVLVYLDGNVVTNASVAATGSTSVTGTMNLQFASSANLVPMDYADLHIQGEGSDSTTTEYNVDKTTNVASGYTVAGSDKATDGADYTFTVTGAEGATVSYTVGNGTATTLTAESEGNYKIPGSAVKGNITITVTAGT